MAEYIRLVDWMNKFEVHINPATVRMIKPNQTDPAKSSILEFTNGDNYSVAGNPMEVMVKLTLD